MAFKSHLNKLGAVARRTKATLWFSWNVNVCVLFVYSISVCVVYVRKKSLLVWCVAPYSDLPTATAAPCQGRPLLPGHEAFFWDLSAAYIHNATSISPRRGEGKDQKWPPPNIGGFLSSFAQTQKHNKREQIPKVMCQWLKTAWQLAANGTPPWSDLGGRRLGTANNGDNCRNHNPGVQFNNRQVQLK